MYRNDEGSVWRRAGAAFGAVAIQAVFVAGLIWGLAAERGDDNAAPLPQIAAFDVDRPTPPPPEPERPSARDPGPEPPAPEGPRSEALPVEAPEAAIPLAPSPAAPSAGEGSRASEGAGERASGAGAGGSGAGSGGGGSGTAAQRIAGALSDSDYPRAAAAARMGGAVAISFRVRTDGRVDRCTVVRSSGHALLDDLTCRLFTQRYRFRPATNARGEPVESTLQTSFTWGTRQRR